MKAKRGIVKMRNHERTSGWMVMWLIIFAGVMACCIAILGVMGDAYGQEWHEANQATVAWNVTTMLADGSDVPADNTVEYAVYLANAITDPGKTSPALVQDNIAGLSYTITLGSEGKYFVGIQAIRKVADGTEVARSSIGWSDDSGTATVPFGLIRYVPPQGVTGLSVQ